MGEKKSPSDESLESFEESYEVAKETFQIPFDFTPTAFVKSMYQMSSERLDENSDTILSDFLFEILPIIVVASAVIEDRSEKILTEFARQDESIDANSKNIEYWSQGKKEEKLSDWGLICDDIVEKMEIVRKTRNNIVHEPQKIDELKDLEYESNTLPEAVSASLLCVKELENELERD